MVKQFSISYKLKLKFLVQVVLYHVIKTGDPKFEFSLIYLPFKSYKVHMLVPPIDRESRPTRTGRVRSTLHEFKNSKCMDPTHGIYDFKIESRLQTWFELKTTYSNTMLNDNLSQKLRLIGNG